MNRFYFNDEKEYFPNKNEITIETINEKLSNRCDSVSMICTKIQKDILCLYKKKSKKIDNKILSK